MSYCVAIALFEEDTKRTAERVAKLQICIEEKWGYAALHPDRWKDHSPYDIFKALINVEHAICADLETSLGTALFVSNKVTLSKQLGITSFRKYLSAALNGRDVNTSDFLLLTGDLHVGRDGEHLSVLSAAAETANLEATQLLAKTFRPALSKHFSTAIVLLTEKHEYVGHVYVWTSPYHANTIHVIGVRTSLENLVCRHTAGVTIKLLHGVRDWAKQNGFANIVINGPVGRVAQIVDKIGFTHKSDSIHPDYRYSTIAHLDTVLTGTCRLISVNHVYPYTKIASLLDEKTLTNDMARLAKEWQAKPVNVLIFLQLRWISRPYDFTMPSYEDYFHFLDEASLLTPAMSEAFNLQLEQSNLDLTKIRECPTT